MPTVLEPEPGGVGHRADGHQRVAALDGAAVGHRHQHAVVGAGHRVGARVLDQRHAAFGEHLLEHRGGVGVLVRQDLVAAGHHGDLHAELGVGVDELGAGDAGADDDEVLGQRRRGHRAGASSGFARRRAPRWAAPAGWRRWRSARRRPVSLPTVPSCAVTLTVCAAMPGTSSTSSPRPAMSVTPSLRSRVGDVGGLRRRQRLDAVVDLAAARSWRPRIRGRYPRSGARRSSVRTPVDAMNVLDGTQSHSTQAPPMPSQSMTVTSATSGPRAAATSAAS